MPKPPPTYSRSDVRTHGVGYSSNRLPAINVKVHDFARGSEASQKALEQAWESHCEQFWDGASTLAAEIFGPAAKVYSEGRSGGWLVVDGIGDPEDWTAPDLGRWRRFEIAIRAEIAYLCSRETVEDTMLANDWWQPQSPHHNAD